MVKTAATRNIFAAKASQNVSVAGALSRIQLGSTVGSLVSFTSPN